MFREVEPSGVRLGRRGFLSAVALAGAGCRARPEDPRALRLGLFANITHAPGLTLAASGALARALPGVRVSTSVFVAGPEAMTALATRAIDACLVGPIPAATHFLRSRGRALRVLAGVCSGGASLVVRAGANIRAPRDLAGRRLATPQLGNSQDVALRRFLRANGLADTTLGGDVTITNTASSNILTLFQRGHLDGAWLPEPWVSRLEQAGGRVLVDERDLWPGRDFASALLVAHPRYAAAAEGNVRALLRGVHGEVQALQARGADGWRPAGEALRSITRVSLPPGVMARAWSRMRFTTDPLTSSVTRMVRDAQSFAMLPPGELAGLVDDAALRRALA